MKWLVTTVGNHKLINGKIQKKIYDVVMKDLPSHIHRIYRQAKLGYGLVKQIATDNPKISGYRLA